MEMSGVRRCCRPITSRLKAARPGPERSIDISRSVAICARMRPTRVFRIKARRSAFDLEQLRVYLEVRAIPDRLSVYVDERLAPGVSNNAEAYGRFWFDNQRFFVQAGQMYLPYGLRLQDDTAYIRQAPGINFATPDRGVEVGIETAQWSAQFAVSNGTAGGPAASNGKQYSLRAEHVRVRVARRRQLQHQRSVRHRQPSDAESLCGVTHRARRVVGGGRLHHRRQCGPAAQAGGRIDRGRLESFIRVRISNSRRSISIPTPPSIMTSRTALVCCGSSRRSSSRRSASACAITTAFRRMTCRTGPSCSPNSTATSRASTPPPGTGVSSGYWA